MYKILDLFAGAGGLSKGFEMTGQFNVAAIVENNKNAAKTYIKNHPGLKNYNDIMKVDFKQIVDEKGKIDVVIGGPPCQGFSNANRQRRQLINGSNEMVKRYVKAIEEIRPKAFVMENVKNIASNKHSFCLTHKDEDYIKSILNLRIYDKDVVLYEGKHVEEMSELCNKFKATKLTLLSEEDLYVVYNIYKKKDQLEKYFAKKVNIKKVQNILAQMTDKPEMPNWYNYSTLRAKNMLTTMVEQKGKGSGLYIHDIKQFWDIQRFFQGILELTEKDAIYERTVSNSSITIRMKTYIVIEFVRNAFKHLGYNINGKVLNAAMFGVPQTRERFIMIGIKQETADCPPVDLPSEIIRNPDDYVTVKHAIGDLEEYEPTVASMDEVQKRKSVPENNSYYRKIVFAETDKTIFNHVCTETREVAKQRFEMIEQGKNFHSLPESLKSTYENPGRTQNTIYKRLAYNLPSDTVVNVRKSMWIHPQKCRAVSAREAARLQSFPDNYIFFGTKDSVYQQIGNAVPPILGRAVAEKVLELIGCTEKYETLREIYDKSVK